jgi:hypothetical protein
MFLQLRAQHISLDTKAFILTIPRNHNAQPWHRQLIKTPKSCMMSIGHGDPRVNKAYARRHRPVPVRRFWLECIDHRIAIEALFGEVKRVFGHRLRIAGLIW